jgi:hypothetical protein
MRPPNSRINFRDLLRDRHAISSCSLFRPGLEITASAPRARVCNLSSHPLSHDGLAAFRHRYVIREAVLPEVRILLQLRATRTNQF